MGWTTPRTWADNDLVNATIMNTHVRDQLNYLLNERPFGDGYDASGGAGYTTTSASDVLVNAALQKTLVLTSTRVLFLFLGSVTVTGANTVIGSLYVDGVLNREVFRTTTGVVTPPQAVLSAALISGLTVGSRTFDIRWRVTAGTGTLYRGASNTYPISFVVKEY